MDNQTSLQINRIIRWTIVGLSIFAILYVLWYFKNIVGYILISVVLSLIGKPVVIFLEKLRFRKLKMPEWLSALITLVLIWLVLGAVVALLVPLIGSQAKKFSEVDSSAILTALQQPIDELVLWLAQYDIKFENNTTLEDYVNEKIVDVFDMSAFSNLFGTIFTFIGELGIAIFSISFITFFFLRDNTLFYKSLLTLTPEKYEQPVKEVIQDTRRLLTSYFVGIAIQVFLVGLCITVGSILIGLNFQLAITIGFAAGLFIIVPYVGPIMSAAFGVMLAITDNLGADFYGETLPVIFRLLGVYVVTKILDDFVFQPYIFSKRVKAHPLELFIVILIAGNIAGVLGMILAIPGYTFIRIIAKQFFSNFTIVQRLTKNI